MTIKLEVGQFWKGIGDYAYLGTYRINKIINRWAMCNKIIYGLLNDDELHFRTVDEQGHILNDDNVNFNSHWLLVEVKLRSIKVIPDIALDTTLHILEAGYIQDRQRKRFRFQKENSK